MELVEVPVLGELARGSTSIDEPVDGACDRVERLLVAEVVAVEDLLAAPVDHLALLVHHLVVLEDVLADLEVAVLDGALRALDRLGDHLRLERHVVGERAPHHPVHRAGREQPHEVVFEREVEAALARGRPGGRSGHGAGCRCGGSRGARCRARRDRRARGPGRPLRRTPRGTSRAAPRSAPRSSSGGTPSASSSLRARPSGLPPRRMSTPRPAMLVATVTPCSCPACVTMCASRSCCLAFSTSCGIPLRVEQSRRAAPTSRPRSCRRAPAGPSRGAPAMSSAAASNLASSVL